MSQPFILSIGEVLWDLFSEGARFGGAPANFACHAAALGADVVMVSAVGDDEYGRRACEILKQYGVDVTLVQTREDAPTGTVAVQVDDRGKPMFTIHEGVAWDGIEWTPQLEQRIADADGVYFGTLSQRSATSRETIYRALEVARESATVRIVDVNLRPPFVDPKIIRRSVEHADVVKLSDDELVPVCRACQIELTEDPLAALRELLERFQLDLIAMTRGADGALLVAGSDTVDQPGIPVDVCDTVGAGDAFTAALAVGWLKGDSLKAIGASACERAAAVCTHPGAVPDISEDASFEESNDG